MPAEAARAIEVATDEGFWWHTIQDLDAIIDRIDRARTPLVQSRYTSEAWQLHDAEVIVRELRDRLLVRNYDDNRKRVRRLGEGQ